MMGSSLIIPITAGRFKLGIWQVLLSSFVFGAHKCRAHIIIWCEKLLDCRSGNTVKIPIISFVLFVSDFDFGKELD